GDEGGGTTGQERCMSLAPPAIEGIRANPTRHFLRQSMAAGAVARGQIVKLRSPADRAGLLRRNRAARAPHRRDDGRQHNYQHRVEGAQENEAPGAPVKSVIPGQHVNTSPPEPALPRGPAAPVLARVPAGRAPGSGTRTNTPARRTRARPQRFQTPASSAS